MWGNRKQFSSERKCRTIKKCIQLVLISLCIFGVASSADTTPPAKVTDLKVVSVTGSSVTITWTAPGNDGNVGTAVLYDIRYSRSFITEASWNDTTKVKKAEGEPKPRPAGSTETFEVTGLWTHTLYYIVLKASDEAENVSELSNMIMLTTTEIELSEGVPEKEELYNIDDVIYYKVKASSGQHLSVILDKEPCWYSYLYIRYGELPTTSEYDAKFDGDKSDQAVDIPVTTAGYYYIMVTGSKSTLSSYTPGYGSYTIAAYTPASFSTLNTGTADVDSLLDIYDVEYYQVYVDDLQHLSVILDKEPCWYSYLYIRYGELPTTSEYDAKFDGDKSDQAVDIPVTTAGYYYIMVTGSKSTLSSYTPGYGSYTIAAYTPASFSTLNTGTADVDSLLDIYDVEYYQVYVDDLQHLSVILDKEPSWYSYFYIRYGQLPTTSEYDAKADGDKSDQAVDIPVTTAGYYYIMVTGSKSTLSSYTPGYGLFAICASTSESSLAIITPNGSEIWAAGTEQNITWTSTGISNIRIEFSVDSGFSWYIITDNLDASTGLYSWNVPKINSAECLVRISDIGGSGLEDQSDNLFAIEYPITGSFEIILDETNASKWFGGDDRPDDKPRNVGAGQSIMLEKDSTINSAGFKFEELFDYYQNPEGVGHEVILILNIRTNDGTIIDTIEKTVSSDFNGGWVIFHCDIDLIESQEYIFTCHVKNGEVLEYQTSILAHTEDMLPNSTGYTGEINISGGNLDDWSNWEIHPWDFNFRLTGSYSGGDQPTLQLTSPNGGENWTAGSLQNITWEQSNMDRVMLMFSSDNGSNWDIIAENFDANAGSYSWTVPEIESSQCLVKITDEFDTDVADVSDSTFTIEVPPKTLTLQGILHHRQTPMSEITNIEPVFSFWDNVTESDYEKATTSYNAADGTYTIENLPANEIEIAIIFYVNKQPIPMPGDYVVWHTLNPSELNDLQRNDYPVELQKVMLLYEPHDNSQRDLAGDEYPLYEPVITFKWESIEGAASYYFDINRVRDDDHPDGYGLIEQILEKVGYPDTLYTANLEPSEPHEHYELWLEADDAGGDQIGVCLIPFTDGYGMEFKFKVKYTEPSVVLTSPNGGEIWEPGSTYNINWISAGVDSIKIDFSVTNGDTWETVVYSVPAAQNSYSWTVPEVFSIECLIRISDVYDDKIADTSDNPFAVTIEKSITLLSPNGGEKWPSNSTQTIQWSSGNIDNVTIEYSPDNGVTWINVVSSTDASVGAYEWTIPGEPAAQCKIIISDFSDFKIMDESDGVFEITSDNFINIVAPRPGDIWTVNSEKKIQWEFRGIENIRIEFSIDDGGTWDELAGSVPALTGSYSFTVPDTPSDRCRVRISDASNPEITVTSELFEINRPELSIYHNPVWEAEELQALDFTATISGTSEIDSVMFYYRKAGDVVFDHQEEMNLIDVDTNEYAFTLETGYFTAPGLEYYIIARDVNGVEARSPVDVGYYSINTRVLDIMSTQLTEGGTLQNAYRMTSIPLNLSYTTIDDQLMGILPPGGSGTDWRLFRFSPGSSTPDEYPNIEGFSPGNAFWLITKNDFRLKASEGTTVTTSEQFNITLKQGWNDIANPWMFDISWDTIENPSGANLSPLYTYEGSWSDPVNPPAVMEPWKGYAVYSYSNINVVIKLQPEPADKAEKLVIDNEDILWMLTIEASAGEAKDIANHLGVREDASVEWDQYDHVEPPPVGEYVSVTFPHYEWELYPYAYTVDFRPPENTISWDFNVKTNIPQKTVVVQLSGTENLPEEYSVEIYDLDMENILDDEYNSFSFVSGKGLTERHFRLIVSSSQEPEPEEDISKPERFVTVNCYPNPFNTQTTIQYELSKPGKVTISIYNVVGQQVQGHDAGYKEHGTYEFVFDASSFTTGIYFYRVDAGYGSVTGKMLYMK